MMTDIKMKWSNDAKHLKESLVLNKTINGSNIIFIEEWKLVVKDEKLHELKLKDLKLY